MNFRIVSSCVALAVLAWTSAACSALDRSAGVAAGKTIRYQVGFLNSADSSANTALSITYSTPDGMQQQQDVGLPWTAVVAAAAGFTPSVSVQFNGFGSIECRIVADNVVIEERTSQQEPYPKVECSA